MPHIPDPVTDRNDLRRTRHRGLDEHVDAGDNENNSQLQKYHGYERATD
jgi:hypothetical protein